MFMGGPGRWACRQVGAVHKAEDSLIGTLGSCRVFDPGLARFGRGIRRARAGGKKKGIETAAWTESKQAASPKIARGRPRKEVGHVCSQTMDEA